MAITWRSPSASWPPSTGASSGNGIRARVALLVVLELHLHPAVLAVDGDPGDAVAGVAAEVGVQELAVGVHRPQVAVRLGIHRQPRDVLVPGAVGGEHAAAPQLAAEPGEHVAGHRGRDDRGVRGPRRRLLAGRCRGRFVVGLGARGGSGRGAARGRACPRSCCRRWPPMAAAPSNVRRSRRSIGSLLWVVPFGVAASGGKLRHGPGFSSAGPAGAGGGAGRLRAGRGRGGEAAARKPAPPPKRPPIWAKLQPPGEGQTRGGTEGRRPGGAGGRGARQRAAGGRSRATAGRRSSSARAIPIAAPTPGRRSRSRTPTARPSWTWPTTASIPRTCSWPAAPPGRWMWKRRRKTGRTKRKDEKDEKEKPKPRRRTEPVRNHLEVFGIPPTLSVLLRRLEDDARKVCFEDVDVEGLRGLPATVTYQNPKAARREFDEAAADAAWAAARPADAGPRRRRGAVTPQDAARLARHAARAGAGAGHQGGAGPAGVRGPAHHAQQIPRRACSICRPTRRWPSGSARTTSSAGGSWARRRWRPCSGRRWSCTSRPGSAS